MNGTRVATSADVGDPVLAVRDLSSGYGRSTVVRRVNLEVRRGSVTALLGPNGAGKTRCSQRSRDYSLRKRAESCFGAAT
jgi:ABC-type transporter Mla maintaining outer membrane lipid asymmetry ATPase subunit MlaF